MPTDWIALAEQSLPAAQAAQRAQDLEQAYLAGTLAHPQVNLSPAQFVQAFASTASSRSQNPKAHAEDLFLVTAVCLGDVVAERVFWTLLKQASQAARKVDANAGFLEDVVQALAQRLLTPIDGALRLKQYVGDVGLMPWLRVAAVRVGINLKAAEKGPVASSAEDKSEEGSERLASADPELKLLSAQHKQLFQQAFQASLESLDAKEKLLLKLYYVDGSTMDVIGRVFGKNKSTISRWVEQAHQNLLQATRVELQRQSGAMGAELESLVGIALSQVSFRLSVLFRNQKGA